LLDDKFEEKHVPFYFCGACLLVTSLLCVVSRFVVVRRLDPEEEGEPGVEEAAGRDRY